MRYFLPALCGALVLAGCIAPVGVANDQATFKNQVVKDCAKDGDLDLDYSVRTLRHARRVMPIDVRKYTKCPAAIRHALAAHRRGQQKRSAVYADCSDNAALDHRYGTRLLRRSLRHLPLDLSKYTSCRAVIRAELDRRKASKA
jgi:hypothetical protein